MVQLTCPVVTPRCRYASCYVLVSRIILVLRADFMKAAFRRFAEYVAVAVGKPAAFFAGVGIIAMWAISGPLFGFSEQWQLMINSFTTIVTFLIVFLIQNTQNRDFAALQLKIDALLLASD